ncbi:MAG: hypothetical protein ACM31O_01480 [Bacteroidota bacterium]
MALDRMEERRRIAARLDEVKVGQETVNDHPEVIAARAKMEAARAAADEARDEFHRVFHKHYVSDEAVTRELLAEYSDLISDGYSGIALCCVTGLPIFVGDRVVEREDSNGARHFLLADVVKIDATLALTAPTKVLTLRDSGIDDDGDGDEEPTP